MHYFHIFYFQIKTHILIPTNHATVILNSLEGFYTVGFHGKSNENRRGGRWGSAKGWMCSFRHFFALIGALPCLQHQRKGRGSLDQQWRRVEVEGGGISAMRGVRPKLEERREGEEEWRKRENEWRVGRVCHFI